MSSKQQAQGVLTLGRKRKEGEGGRGFDALIKVSKRAAIVVAKKAVLAEPQMGKDNRVLAEPMMGKDNRVLAGYLAHEFLTKGTLLGEKWDPARAEATPIAPVKPNLKQRREATAAAAAASEKKAVGEVAPVEKQHQSYAEVASLLKSDGVHIEGIFNPTQLARWLKM